MTDRPPLSSSHKQQLRHVILAALANRPGNALSPRQVLHIVGQEVDFKLTEAAVLEALQFLVGWAGPAPILQKVTDDFGPGDYFKATSAGVLKAERDENA